MNGLDPRAADLRQFFGHEIAEGPDRVFRAPLSVRKPSGQRLRGLLASPGGDWRGAAVVLPGLGRTMRHSGALALALARHGYATVRFDPTNHTGDSDGEIVDATLSGVSEDLSHMSKLLRGVGWRGPLVVIASSAFARAAIRASRQDLPADGMALLLPVVFMAKTLAVVAGEDLIEAYRRERIKPHDPVQVLSHQMSGRFLADAIANGFCDLEGTRAELRAAKMPVSAIAAEGDDWVSVDDVAAAVEPERPQRRLFVLEDSDHDSYSFGFMRAVTRTAIRAIAEMTREPPGEPYALTFTDLSVATKTEKTIFARARESWRLEHD
jgi:Acyl transferase